MERSVGEGEKSARKKNEVEFSVCYMQASTLAKDIGNGEANTILPPLKIFSQKRQCELWIQHQYLRCMVIRLCCAFIMGNTAESLF